MDKPPLCPVCGLPVKAGNRHVTVTVTGKQAQAPVVRHSGCRGEVNQP
jgi:hypothetical protein